MWADVERLDRSGTSEGSVDQFDVDEDGFQSPEEFGRVALGHLQTWYETRKVMNRPAEPGLYRITVYWQYSGDVVGTQVSPVPVPPWTRAEEDDQMPGKPTAHELTENGTGALCAVHAVTDMATAPSSLLDGLMGRFQSLCTINVDYRMGGAHHATFRLSLTRLAFMAAKKLQQRGDATDRRDRAPLTELLRNEDEQVKRLALAAARAATLPDFIRATGYGSQPPASAFDLGITAAVLLRELLDEVEDPALRWAACGTVTNPVVALHYLRA